VKRGGLGTGIQNSFKAFVSTPDDRHILESFSTCCPLDAQVFTTRPGLGDSKQFGSNNSQLPCDLNQCGPSFTVEDLNGLKNDLMVVGDCPSLLVGRAAAPATQANEMKNDNFNVWQIYGHHLSRINLWMNRPRFLFPKLPVNLVKWV
jgi:hypothetical protein